VYGLKQICISFPFLVLLTLVLFVLVIPKVRFIILVVINTCVIGTLYHHTFVGVNMFLPFVLCISSLREMLPLLEFIPMLNSFELLYLLYYNCLLICYIC
jgi:hypothetical protein